MKLGDIATYVNGYAFKPSDWGNTGLPIIRIQDLTGSGYQSNYYNGDYPSKIEINDGDVLISWSASLGVYIWNGGKALLNQHIFKVIFDKIKINKQYFVYAVQYNLDIMTSKMHGATMKHIIKKDFDNIEILYRSEDKQNEIVRILTKLENMIVAYKQLLKGLDDLIKSRFVEMFGIPGSDEKGWGLSELGKCCELNPKKGVDKRLQLGMKVSFVPMSSVTEDGAIDVSEIKLYDEVKTGFTYFSENDVLFAKITPCMENGKGAVAAGLCNGVGFGSTEFHVIRPVKNISNPYWLYHLTSFNTFRNDAAANMTGSAGQRRVPVTFLENYKISLPPIDIQNKFAAFVHQVDKLKFETQKSLKETQTLMDSLMQEYFG